MHGHRGASALYRNTAIDSGHQLSPQRQLVMLLRGLVERLRTAERLMVAGDVAGKVKAISGSFPILEVLRGSLDFDANPTLAARLADIYDTASVWLADANARNDVGKLQQVIGVLDPIAEAYAALPDASAPAPAPSDEARP